MMEAEINPRKRRILIEAPESPFNEDRQPKRWPRKQRAPHIMEEDDWGSSEKWGQRKALSPGKVRAMTADEDSRPKKSRRQVGVRLQYELFEEEGETGEEVTLPHKPMPAKRLPDPLAPPVR